MAGGDGEEEITGLKAEALGEGAGKGSRRNRTWSFA